VLPSQAAPSAGAVAAADSPQPAALEPGHSSPMPVATATSAGIPAAAASAAAADAAPAAAAGAGAPAPPFPLPRAWVLQPNNPSPPPDLQAVKARLVDALGVAGGTAIFESSVIQLPRTVADSLVAARYASEAEALTGQIWGPERSTELLRTFLELHHAALARSSSDDRLMLLDCETKEIVRAKIYELMFAEEELTLNGVSACGLPYTALARSWDVLFDATFGACYDGPINMSLVTHVANLMWRRSEYFRCVAFTAAESGEAAARTAGGVEAARTMAGGDEARTEPGDGGAATMTA